MAEERSERAPRRDPGQPIPERAPGAQDRPDVNDNPVPEQIEVEGQVEGSATDFEPQTITDVAQQAPGPHGQGDEPTSANEGKWGYEDDPAPKVRPAGKSER